MSGTGCPGSAGVPTLSLSGLPWLGDTVDLLIGNVAPTAAPFTLVGFSNTSWSGGSLPASLVGFGFPACNLLVSPDATVLALGPVPLAIPSGVHLAGVGVFAQGAVLEVVASTLTLGMSPSVDMVLGAR